MAPNYGRLSKALVNAISEGKGVSGLLGYEVNGEFKVVSDDPKKFYVRFPNGNFVAAYHFNKVVPSPHTPVKVSTDNIGNPIILGMDTQSASQSNPGSYGAGVGLHDHVRGSGLEYIMDAWFLKQFRVDVTSGFILSVAAGAYVKNNSLMWFSGGSIDISEHVPVSSANARWVIIGFNTESGELVATPSEEFIASVYADFTQLSLIEYYELEYNPLCAVYLVGGSTTIPSYNFEDLRLVPQKLLSYLSDLADFSGYAYEGYVLTYKDSTWQPLPVETGAHVILTDDAAFAPQPNLNFLSSPWLLVSGNDDTANDETEVQVSLNPIEATEIPETRLNDVMPIWDESMGNISFVKLENLPNGTLRIPLTTRGDLLTVITDAVENDDQNSLIDVGDASPEQVLGDLDLTITTDANLIHITYSVWASMDDPLLSNQIRFRLRRDDASGSTLAGLAMNTSIDSVGGHDVHFTGTFHDYNPTTGHYVLTVERLTGSTNVYSDFRQMIVYVDAPNISRIPIGDEGDILKVDSGLPTWVEDRAIHNDVPDEFDAAPEKTTLVGDDRLLLEDSESIYDKKWVKVSNLPSGGGGGGDDPDAIHIDEADEFDTASQKMVLDDDDRILIEDSADSYAKKWIAAEDLPSGGGGGGDYPKYARIWHDASVTLAGTTLTTVTNPQQRYNTWTFQDPPAINDEFENGFFLKAGTYTFRVCGIKGETYGMIDWELDGVNIVTGQDWYDPTSVFSHVIDEAGVVVGTDGWHRLVGKVTAQNPSALDYHMLLTFFEFIPTSY